MKLWQKNTDANQAVDRFHGGTRPGDGPLSGRSRRARFARTYAHAQLDRIARRRRPAGRAARTKENSCRHRSRTLHDRRRYRRRPFPGGVPAHRTDRRRGQEDSQRTFAKRPGTGRPADFPAPSNQGDRRGRGEPVPPVAKPFRQIQRGADARLHAPADRHALFVRAVARRLRRKPRGRHRNVACRLPHLQQKPARLSGRLRLVVPAQPHDDHRVARLRHAELQRGIRPDGTRENRNGSWRRPCPR